MIYFQCDYEEGCHPAILKRLNETNLEQTVGYSMDPYCASAREKIKKAVGRPDADVHFLVGGTQTNMTVIAAALKPWQGAICADTVILRAMKLEQSRQLVTRYWHFHQRMERLQQLRLRRL